jgi:hypothetical protein
MSLNPDVVLKTRLDVAEAEKRIKAKMMKAKRMKAKR